MLNYVYALQLMVMVFFLAIALHWHRHNLINQLLLVFVNILVQAVPTIVRYHGLELIILLIYVGRVVFCSFIGRCSLRWS